jgi:hypothetical protein
MFTANPQHELLPIGAGLHISKLKLETLDFFKLSPNYLSQLVHRV